MFGYRLEDYDALLFEELDLLLNVRAHEHDALVRQVPPDADRPGRVSATGCRIPCRSGWASADTPRSFARAGALGLPLMVRSLAAKPLAGFRPLIDLYSRDRDTARPSAGAAEVRVHMLQVRSGGSTQEAADTVLSGYAKAMTDVRKGTRVAADDAGKFRRPARSDRRSADRQRSRRGRRQDPSTTTRPWVELARLSFQMNAASLPQIR